MSTTMIKLRPSQRASWPVRHDLLRKVPKPLTDEQLEEIRPACQAACEDARSTLVLGHLAMLRHTVGRYLCHWPVTRRFEDEMVSAGLYALVRAVARLDEAVWPDTVGLYLLNSICAEIEDEVARLRGISPAPPSTNRRRLKNGEEPIYGEAESLPAEVTALNTDVCSDCYTVDVSDTIEFLQGQSPRQARFLAPDGWGLSDRELSERLGVSRQTVSRNRASLLTRYFELAGE